MKSKWLSSKLICVITALVMAFSLCGCSTPYDVKSTINKVTDEAIKGLVGIICMSFDAEKKLIQADFGSGFCFKQDDDYYYLLTNYHVIYPVGGDRFSYREVHIKSYNNSSYSATLYRNPNKNTDAYSTDYDLACLVVPTKNTTLGVLNLASSNPGVGTEIIDLGAPNHQANAIKLGTVKKYDTVTLENKAYPDEQDLEFDLIYHDACLGSGASGGPLLDTDLNMVGVNKSSTDTNKIGHAIPIEKVNEFLSEFVYD